MKLLEDSSMLNGIQGNFSAHPLEYKGIFQIRRSGNIAAWQKV